MSHAVILDDLQCRHDAFRAKYGSVYDTIQSCYNLAEFVHHVLAYPGIIDYLTLDHDLGDSNGFILYGNGMDAVKFLAILPMLSFLRVNVHSHNYVAAERMYDYLQAAGYGSCVTYAHFTDE